MRRDLHSVTVEDAADHAIDQEHREDREQPTRAELRTEDAHAPFRPRCRCGGPLGRRGPWTLTTCNGCAAC